MTGGVAPRRCATMLLTATLLIAAAPRPAGAQQGPGSVEGSAYWVTVRGERRPAGVGVILLLRDSDALRASLDAVCRAQRRAAAAVEDSLARLAREVADTMQTPVGDPWTSWWEAETDLRGARIETRLRLAASGRAAIHRLLGEAAVDSAPAGPAARFRFAGLPAGRYILFGEWASGPATWQWWEPLALAEGAALTRDLRGAGEASDQFSCRYP